MSNDTSTNATTTSAGRGSSNTTIADAILGVYTVVQFSDFEYCQAGCWISLAVLSLVVSLVVLRPLLKRILPNSKELFWAVFFVLLEIASDGLEILYAVLGFSKFLNAPTPGLLTPYNRWWLALSSIGFGLGGLLELIGLGDAFCRRTVLDRVLGSGWIPCCCFFAPSEEEEVRSRLERFPRLSDRMRWGWFRRGVWWEVFLFYLCFGILATVTPLQNGYLCWLIYPVFTMMVSCILLKIDPNDGEGATAFLFPRTLEAVVIAAPLLVIEVLATRSIGFLTGALLIRDALGILWTVVDFCQQPKEETPSPRQQLAGAAEMAGEKLQQLAMVPTQTMSVAMSTVSRNPSQDQDPSQPPPQQEGDVETAMGKLHHLATLPTQTINTAMSSIRGNSSQERDGEEPQQQRQSYVETARGKLHHLATLPTRTIQTAVATVSQKPSVKQQEGQLPSQPQQQQQQQQQQTGAVETARAKLHQIATLPTRTINNTMSNVNSYPSKVEP